MRPVRPIKTLVLALLLGLAGFILWPYFGKFTAPDESTFIYEGFLVSSLGRLPYRDFFDFILPGTFYITALVNLLTGGVSLIALRLVAFAMLTTCCTLTVLIGKRYLSTPWLWALGGVLWFLNFPGGMEIQHHLYSTFFAMLAVWFLWQSVIKDSLKKIIYGGVCMGLAALCTQSLGGLLGFALMLFLIWQRGLKTTLRYYVLPAAAPVVITFLFFAAQGAFGDLWHSTVTWLYEGGYRQTSSNTYLLDGIVKFSSIVNSTIAHPSILWKRTDLILYLPIVLALAFLPPLGLLWPVEVIGRRLCKKENLEPRHWQLILLWFSAAGFFLATLSYPNTRLVAYHGFIPVLLALVALQHFLKPHPTLGKALCMAGVVYTLAMGFVQADQSFRMLQLPRFISYGTVEKTLVAPDYFPPGYVLAYNQMIGLLHELCPPGETLFVYNHAPEIYLLSDRHNPTRFQLLMHTLDTPAQIEETTAKLQQSLPAVIIYDRLDEKDFLLDHRFRKLRKVDFRLHGIEALLEARYQLAGQMGGLLIFTRQ